MATTAVGNPYVESSDLVANYPGVSETLAERIDVVGVNPFADAAARTTAIPSPVEGQMSSLADTDRVERYNGSAWTAVGGKILQVVSADYAVQTLTTSASYVTSGLTASITPSLATSKVIIFATTSGVAIDHGGMGFFSLFRGTAAGTNIGPEVNAYGDVSDVYWSLHITGIDSPSTTSAQVYTLCMKKAAGEQIGAQLGNVKAQMILMEVSA